MSPTEPRIRQFMPAIAAMKTNFSHISSMMSSLGRAVTRLPAQARAKARTRSLRPPARSP